MNVLILTMLAIIVILIILLGYFLLSPKDSVTSESGPIITSRVPPPWPCCGLVGWISGHDLSAYSGTQVLNNCKRCGMPQGGWQEQVLNVTNVTMAPAENKEK